MTRKKRIKEKREINENNERESFYVFSVQKMFCLGL